MRSFALIALISFSAQVHAEEPAVTDVSNELADKLLEKLADKLADTGMDGTTLGKPGNLAQASRAIPAQATSGAHSASCGALKFSIQAYSPFDGKKYETLSYLPQISNQDIEKQISYMIRNSWTPGLEFSQDGDVYLNTRMGPGYYDNRYWSMYKLPMFGCTDPSSVVREIENCSREFPGAKVRVIAYDSIKQVQVAGFIVRK